MALGGLRLQSVSSSPCSQRERAMPGSKTGVLTLLAVVLSVVVAGCHSGRQTRGAVIRNVTNLPLQSSVPPLDPSVFGGDSQPPIVDQARVGLTKAAVEKITGNCAGNPDIGANGCARQVVRAGHLPCRLATFCAHILFVPSTGRYVYQIVDSTAQQAECGQGPGGTCFQLAINPDAVSQILKASQDQTESNGTSPSESEDRSGSASPDDTNSMSGSPDSPVTDSPSSSTPPSTATATQ